MAETAARRASQRTASRAVVDPDEQLAAERRSRFSVLHRSDRKRRITPTALVGVVMMAAIAFAATATHVSLINQQTELDGIRSEITKVQTSNKELRERESRLQSSAEVRRIAIEELGMVEPAQPAFVTPDPQVVGNQTPATPNAVEPATGSAQP